MIRIRLPEGEAQRLELAFRQETDPKYKDRIQIVRLASRDRPHQEIAQDLAITPRTVQRWLNAYRPVQRPRGHAGVTSQKGVLPPRSAAAPG